MFIIISDSENCAFGPFEHEYEAITWAKMQKHWPTSSWRVLIIHPYSIG